MKERIRVWVLVVLFITLIGVLSRFAFEEESVLGSSVVNYKSVPYITSVPMGSLYVGELFRYFVEVSDLDTELEGLTISLTEKPQWMYMEGNEVKGVPSESGTYRYIVTVSDGESSSSVLNYVLVEVYE